ncbi:MAG: flagellar basal body P-ring formation protein FlgA [Candidatus Hydrogenedentes bacterium]|nr:flagellar basal body P-ring formation protein FlgA [Candidatus Hydrogenedentota bacterium]
MKLTSSIWKFAAIPLYLLCMCRFCHAETVITMKDAVLVDGFQVRLGDIASISGVPAAQADKLARLEIVSAPKPGHSKEIDRDFAVAKLRQNGYRNIFFKGAGSTIATRSSQTIASDKLAEMLASYIESHMPWKAADTVIDVQPPPVTAGLPSGNIAVKFESDGRYRYVDDAIFKTTILVGGKRCKTLYMRASVHPFQRIAVAVEDIKRGELISESDFSMVRKDLADLTGGFFADRAGLHGLVAARSIPTGTVISLRCVERPIAIKRGNIVVAEVRGNGFRITAMAKAMDNGRVGDVIRLMNVDSRKTLTGEVLDETTVRVVRKG